jgi:threonine/homoserine/homoserine lactone efflux protein
MTFELITTFIISSAAICIAPGPDNLFVLTQSALYGRNSGIYITLGLCTGLIFHTIAVAFGVATLFQESELAFNVLKILGATYLVYLAYRTLKEPPSDIKNTVHTIKTTKKLYFRGIFMNITNPKVSIFFLAFLPQFTDPQKGSIAFQFLTLGGLFILVALSIFSLIASLSSKLKGWLIRSPKNQVYLNLAASAVFVSLAIKLLASSANL